MKELVYSNTPFPRADQQHKKSPYCFVSVLNTLKNSQRITPKTENDHPILIVPLSKEFDNKFTFTTANSCFAAIEEKVRDRMRVTINELFHMQTTQFDDEEVARDDK